MRELRRASQWPCWIWLLAGLAGCGYQLEGRGVFLPKHIERVAVPVFQNQSYERDVEILLTNAILDEISRRGGVKLVQDEAEADAVLRGVVEDYRIDVLATERGGQASAYRVSIRVKIVFDDLVEKKPYWQNTLSKIQDFRVDESAASTQVQEREAIQQAAEDFAKTVVTAIFLGF